MRSFSREAAAQQHQKKKKNMILIMLKQLLKIIVQKSLEVRLYINYIQPIGLNFRKSNFFNHKNSS